MIHLTKNLFRFLKKLIKMNGYSCNGQGAHSVDSDNLPSMTSVHKLSGTEFLSLFNIEAVSELLQRGRVDSATNALIEYFRQKVKKDWLRVADQITDLRLNVAGLSDENLIDQAELILSYKLTHSSDKPLVTADGKIDWLTNPTSNREWILRLNRHQWWTILALAYDVNKDERYAEAFVSQMLDWIDRNPPSRYKNEASSTWRLMEVGLRMRISWIPVFALFFDSPSFSDEAKIMMLRSIYDHAKFLSLFKSKLNHLVRESNGLICVSIYFQEFSEALGWQEVALNRLENALRRQINQDGSQIEVSTGYQMLVIEEFEQTYDLLRENEIQLPGIDLGEWLQRMYQVLLKLIRPDGSFPEINDGFLLKSRKALEYAGYNFDRDDFVFAGTGGKEGTAPIEASTEIGDAGLYVMRSDWSEGAHYLLFDAGPYGGFHGHEDKLSIEVFAHGQSFIVDSGSYTYEKTDPYRRYFVGSEGHNTVLVDGLSQVRRWHDEHNTPYVANKKYAIWESQPEFDYVCAVYDEGYGEFELKRPKSPSLVKDVEHTRHVIFVKSDYWLIVDELQTTKPHEYQLLFHCPPEIDVNEIEYKSVILSTHKRDCSLQLIPASPEDVTVSWVAGSEQPIQGWYSVDHHRKAAAPAICYEARSTATKVLVTLLYPGFKGKYADKASIGILDVSDEESIACVVESRHGRDYLMLSKNKEMKSFGPYESDAILTGYRTSKTGVIKRKFAWYGEDRANGG